MSFRRRLAGAGALFLVTLGMMGRASADSFGLGDQELAIGAAEFRSVDDAHQGSVGIGDGYLYYPNGVVVAPVRLPEGAEIFQICLYANDPGAASDVVAYLEAVTLAPGGQSPGLLYPAPGLTADFDIGYGVVCTDPFSYTFRSTGDIDGNGTVEHVAHRLHVYIDGNAGLGGVRILWRRQVSSKPGIASFNDVPTTHPYFQFIEALKKAGITGGCQQSPPLYCPDKAISRGELAVYLAAALGLQWP